jgi:hypothetical protein
MQAMYGLHLGAEWLSASAWAPVLFSVDIEMIKIPAQIPLRIFEKKKRKKKKKNA